MPDLPFSLSAPTRWMISLGAGAVLLAVAGGVGWRLGQQSAQAEGEARLARLQRDHAAWQLEQQQRTRTREHQLATRAAELDAQLRDSQDRHARQSRVLQQRIDDVTRHYRPAPDAPPVPLPRCVFTRGFVSVYNAAIGAAPVPADPAASGPAATTGPAAELDAGVSPADLLAHVTDYGQRCQDIENRLNRLIDWQQALAPAPRAAPPAE